MRFSYDELTTREQAVAELALHAVCLCARLSCHQVPNTALRVYALCASVTGHGAD